MKFQFTFHHRRHMRLHELKKIKISNLIELIIFKKFNLDSQVKQNF